MMPPAQAPHDAGFEKYRRSGAYHWKHVGRALRGHNAFTAERYRRTVTALGDLRGMCVLDYGCGDGALSAMLAVGVGPDGDVHGYDPNDDAIRLAAEMLPRAAVVVRLHADRSTLPDAHFDAVVCADVIEHVHDPEGLLAEIARVLRPGGRAVITTPVRLTERPEDPNHVREWFPHEFRELLERGPLTLLEHTQAIPAAAVELYSWRPAIIGRIPAARLLCNLVSVYGHRNALTWLGLPAKRFALQLAVLERPSPSTAERTEAS